MEILYFAKILCSGSEFPLMYGKAVEGDLDVVVFCWFSVACLTTDLLCSSGGLTGSSGTGLYELPFCRLVLVLPSSKTCTRTSRNASFLSSSSSWVNLMLELMLFRWLVKSCTSYMCSIVNVSSTYLY